MSRATRLTVVMPARNVRAHVDEAVESILGQTFGDFDFVIRDDGSTDGTSERLRDWARHDKRIRLFEGPRLGPAGSSNWLVQQCRTPLVARMDADDVARVNRLERQISSFEKHSGLVLVGSLSDTIDEHGQCVRGTDYWRTVRRSHFAPFPHTSVMFRRDAFDFVGGYREQCNYWEDLDLYLRLSQVGALAVVAEPLVSYRVSNVSCRRVPAERDSIEAAVDRMYAALERCDSEGHYGDFEPGAATPGRRLRPMALVSLSMMRLWAGERPHLLHRLAARGRFRADAQTILILGWAALGAASPGGLRLVLRTLSAIRNRIAAAKVRRGELYRWTPSWRGSTSAQRTSPTSPGFSRSVASS